MKSFIGRHLGTREGLGIHLLPDLKVFGNDNDTFFIHDHRSKCTRQFETFEAAERFAKWAKVVYEIYDFTLEHARKRFQ